MRTRAAVLILLSLVAAACSSSTPSSSASTTHKVHELHQTFVDTSRTTPAHSTVTGSPQRTLATTIWYPADRKGAPYPLIVFGHGLSATPATYQAFLTHWAAAGFVVAAPAFPLTNGDTPGGTQQADTSNQPRDMSYVISSVLKLAAATSGPLSGLVDVKEIGVAGHSNGAITTLGLIANSCCQDKKDQGRRRPVGRTCRVRQGHVRLHHGTTDADRAWHR